MISAIELAYSVAVLAPIHKSLSPFGQRAGSHLGGVRMFFLGGSFCSSWLGFLTGICQVLLPECDICGNRTPLIGPHRTVGCGHQAVGSCYVLLPSLGGEFPSVQG